MPGGVQAIPLARYLARAWPLTPGWVFKKALKAKDVRINGVKSGAEAMVCAGDQLSLYIEDKYLTGAIRVLYEKDGLLAVEKIPGLPVDADEDGICEDTALNRARNLYKTARLVHRLDTGTGGVLLMALDDRREEELLLAFNRHTIRKFYTAVVKGTPSPEEGTLTNNLIKDAATARVRVARCGEKGALRAELAYRVAHAKDGMSWVEIELFTGRTHQVRVQFAHIGCPLVGDDKYGDRMFNRARSAQKNPALWCVRMLLPDGTMIESQEKFYV